MTGDPKLSDSPDAAKPQTRLPTPWTPRIEVHTAVPRTHRGGTDPVVDYCSDLKRRSIEYQVLLDP